jgi:hypothetical protein
MEEKDADKLDVVLPLTVEKEFWKHHLLESR